MPKRRITASLAVLLVCGLLAPCIAAEVSVGEVKGGAGSRSLAAQLAREVEIAKKKSLRPFVEVSADWCKPCQAVAKYLTDPLMVAAFDGVHLIRVDVDGFTAESLTQAGIAATAVPTFYELDARGHATGRTIVSNAWGDDVPKNMAPPLRAFFAPR